jgi:hypothetical protein
MFIALLPLLGSRSEMAFRGSSSFGRASVLTLALLGACAVETQGTDEEPIPLVPGGGSSGSGGSGAEPGAGTFSGGTPGASGTFTSGTDSGGNPFAGGMFGGGNPSVGGTAGTGGTAGSGGVSGGMGGGGSGGKAGAGGTGGKGGAGGSGGSVSKACGTGKLTIAGCTAESEENAGLVAAQACDGNATSRWSSAHSEPQWIWFDLGQVAHVGRVLINWEAAYASSYRLEVADNSNGPWTEISTQNAANGGMDDITNLDDAGRYVRMFGVTRATMYGFSIFELEVYGDLDENCN